MRLIVIIVLLAFGVNTFAQINPFEEYGYHDVTLLTLSDGAYNEVFDNDTLVQIGSVIINTKTKRLTAFVEVDTIYDEASLEPDIISRWMSPDPLAEKYYEWTPYNYVSNNPIIFIDPNGEDKVIAIVYNQRKDSEKSLWAVQVSYDIDKGVGSYKGMMLGDDFYGKFQGNFNKENKSNFLNADLFTEKGALAMYHSYENGEQEIGLSDVNTNKLSFDQRWNDEGTKIPTSLVTTISDAFNILNDVSVADLPLGENGADKINELFKDFDGTVEYINDEDGNHSFRFSVSGTDISFKIDYVITNDENER